MAKGFPDNEAATPNFTVGIVIPTYNEGENVTDLIEQILTYVPSAEIAVVDDSADTSTVDAVRSVNRPEQVRVIHRANKAGRGSAVLEGFRCLLTLNPDLLIEMDADFSHPPSQLPSLIDYASCEGCDILIASRDVHGSMVLEWPLFRIVLHRLGNLLMRTVLQLKVRDYTNGYRVYSRKAIEIMLKHSGKITGGFWSFGETLVQVSLRGGVIRETPTVFVNRTRGKSTVTIREIISTLNELAKVYLLKRTVQKQLRQPASHQ